MAGGLQFRPFLTTRSHSNSRLLAGFHVVALALTEACCHFGVGKVRIEPLSLAITAGGPIGLVPKSTLIHTHHTISKQSHVTRAIKRNCDKFTNEPRFSTSRSLRIPNSRNWPSKCRSNHSMLFISYRNLSIYLTHGAILIKRTGYQCRTLVSYKEADAQR